MTVSPARPKSPSLNALKAFEAAARYQSFVKAAQELNVTAGAIAQQVKQLEDWIGCPLFQRSAQGIKLTPEAQLALPMLSTAFDQLSDAVTRLRHVSKPTEIAIAALPSVALLWLSPKLPQLAKAFPDYYFSVAALEQPPNFRREAYDLAIFYVNDGARGIRRIGLGQDELFPVCAPSLLQAQQAQGKDWTGLRLLHDTAWRDYWALWLAAAGVKDVNASAGAEFSLYSMALQAAIDGAGVLMGRGSLVRHALEAGLLVAASDVRIPAANELSVLLPDSSPLLSQIDLLIASLGESNGQAVQT